jgi:hypothetical protein
MAKERAWKQPSTKTKDNASETALLPQMEDAWTAARILGKSKIVEQMVDDAYRGATSHGQPQTKEELIAAVEKSAGEFTQCVHSERALDLRGDVAISTGIATLSSPKRQHSGIFWCT